MRTKKVPFTKEFIQEVIKKHPTPFHIYDENAMRENVRDLIQAFSWNKGFKEYFAIKAAPNPYIMKIFKEEGCGIDCSSFGELVLAEKVGLSGDDIMFTSNDTPVDEYLKASDLGAIINLDDISHITYLEKHVGLPELICFRYNPGALKEGNVIIGHPEEAKYGFTREQLFEGFKLVKEKGVKRFGLHTMVASNELDETYFAETAHILFQTVAEISKELNIEFEFVNLGGGIGIPYKPDQKPVDYKKISEGIKIEYDKYITGNGLKALKIYLEAGRVMTGPYGYLVSKVLHMKNTYKQFAGLDASMSDLMRPALYGAYHHITALGKEKNEANKKYDVTGSLCENNDKFAIDRELPELEPGDILVIHDTGAHGHAMGFNYNAKLRSAELLLRKDGSIKLIRRQETVDDYFATIDFEGLKNFKV